MEEIKSCLGCGAIFWPPVGKDFADFCDPCFGKVRKGTALRRRTRLLLWGAVPGTTRPASPEELALRIQELRA